MLHNGRCANRIVVLSEYFVVQSATFQTVCIQVSKIIHHTVWSGAHLEAGYLSATALLIRLDLEVTHMVHRDDVLQNQSSNKAVLSGVLLCRFRLGCARLYAPNSSHQIRQLLLLECQPGVLEERTCTKEMHEGNA